MGWYIHWYTGDIWGPYAKKSIAHEVAEVYAAFTYRYKARWHMFRPRYAEGGML